MLREHTIYLKFSTFHDLVYDATFLEILELLHTWNHGPFAHYQNLEIRSKPRPVTPGLLLEKLHGLVGQGVHRKMRFKLWNDPKAGGPVRSFELNAGAHPYTGMFQTLLDIRVERDWFVRNPEQAPRVCRKRFDTIAALTHPFQAHAHDTDDNAIQNIDNPGLLRRGFGLEVTEPISLEHNPGREISRGAWRYAINWLTLFGPELANHLGQHQIESLPGEIIVPLPIDPHARKKPIDEVVERMGGELPPLDNYKWLLLQLGPTPLAADEPKFRQRQHQAREHLQLRELAARERWKLGYWQRKS